MKIVIESRKEEQIMILMVAQQYQIIHHIEEDDYKRFNFTESLAKSLFHIQFDAYEIAIKIDEDTIFEYIDENTSYERMLEEGAVKIFRDIIKKHNFEVQSDD